MSNNIFQQAKQAFEMRSQLKKIQKAMENEQGEYTNAGVTVVANGNASLVSVSIDPSAAEPANLKRLERTITENANKALNLAKEKGAKLMQDKSKEMGLDKFFGG